MRHYSRTTFLATVSSLIAVCAPAGAQHAPVTVTIDGAPVTFDQPPLERAGRVFVPLRGVFEKLGASVVYDRGRINATKGPTTIALTVGSTAALVNGQQQFLDNPPLVIGSRVLVPLRFVSQALGTTVNFERAKRNVAITIPAAPSLPRRTLDLASASGLMNMVPADHSTASPHLAQITAGFVHEIDPKSARATLDGGDITPEVFVTPSSFIYYVVTPLASGTHTVTLNAKSPSGQAVHGTWSFTST